MLKMLFCCCFGEFCEEPCRSQNAVTNLKRKPRPFIKRAVNARCSFDRIRPTFTKTLQQSFGVTQVDVHRLVVSQGRVRRFPLLQNCRYQPGRQGSGPLLYGSAGDIRPEELVSETNSTSDPIPAAAVIT